MINLTVNGKEIQLDEPTNLVEYLNSLEVNPSSIAVAIDGTVLRREEWGSVTLADGAHIEIVRAVGGG